jgi:ABC-type branched-subunit amino acid transport system substrate-binding protein
MLVAFHHTYPEHPYTSDAMQLTEVVKQRLAFAPYTVGCLVPLTGSYKAYGQRMLNAVQMALSGMQTGETPLPIKLVVKDSASDDFHAIEAVRQLAQAGVGAIIGPIITSQAAASEAQRLNIPIVTFTQKADIANAGDFVFRHFITPRNQVKTLVEFFIGELNLRRFAVMYPQEAYGDTFMNLFWDELVKQGGHMVGVESYDPKQTDFADTIKKLIGTYYSIPEELQTKPVVQVEEYPYYQATPNETERLEDVLPDPVTRLTGLFFQDPDQDRIKGPALGRRREEKRENPIIDFDVLFIPDAPKVTGLILPQLAYHDVKNIYTAGTNLWHSQQLINMTQQYAQNAVMVDGFYKDSQSRIVQNFVEQYQAIYGATPGLMEAFAFDTANMIFGLLAHPQIELRNQLRNAMMQLFYVDGVTGTTAFAPDGEAIKRLSLLRVKGDRFVEITHP